VFVVSLLSAPNLRGGVAIEFGQHACLVNVSGPVVESLTVATLPGTCLVGVQPEGMDLPDFLLLVAVALSDYNEFFRFCI
jgi:hypothetical protein